MKIDTIKTSDIAKVLLFAKQRISYCKAIWDHVDNSNGRFDPTQKSTQFYYDLCNAMFTESLLIVHTLLHGKTAEISFSGWAKSSTTRPSKAVQHEITVARKKFDLHGFRKIRHKVLAHLDIDTEYNAQPFFRKGIVGDNVVVSLLNIIEMLVLIFWGYTQELNNIYSPSYFDTNEIFQLMQIVMASYPPTLDRKNLSSAIGA